MKAVLDMQCPAENHTLPDCDCPYEHWHIGHGVCLDIHHEPDGSIHRIGYAFMRGINEKVQAALTAFLAARGK